MLSEKYRDYYDDFKDITFMDYENWPDERWVDVSNSSWQNHIISEASRLKNLGAKGIFMDNFDVYYIASEEYECSNDFKEGIYQGCKTILEQLHALELSLLINSGSMFFRRLIEEESPDINYIDWYAQECVFSTIIDYDHDVFARQEQEEKEYNLENIALMKDKSNILLIEYTKNEKLAKEIKKFSELNNFNYFISKKVNLE